MNIDIANMSFSHEPIIKYYPLKLSDIKIDKSNVKKDKIKSIKKEFDYLKEKYKFFKYYMKCCISFDIDNATKIKEYLYDILKKYNINKNECAIYLCDKYRFNHDVSISFCVSNINIYNNVGVIFSLFFDIQERIKIDKIGLDIDYKIFTKQNTIIGNIFKYAEVNHIDIIETLSVPWWNYSTNYIVNLNYNSNLNNSKPKFLDKDTSSIILDFLYGHRHYWKPDYYNYILYTQVLGYLDQFIHDYKEQSDCGCDDICKIHNIRDGYFLCPQDEIINTGLCSVCEYYWNKD